MNYAQIIAGFRELLEESNSFDRQALQDLPQLEKTLDQLSDDDFNPVADAIVDWCAAHQPLGENLRMVAVRWIPPKANPADEEGIKKNISVIRETVKQKAANPQPPAPNSNQTVSNDD
ncbi:hypothetical protein [Coleofasciculus sp.]|uniref:hypothetical protein n=1 Tax=Coleofasciculus sp. TaxID=3100458 RepID=UPI003A31AFE6